MSQLTLSDWIGVIGAVVTVLSTLYTLWLAAQVRATHRTIEQKYRKMSLVDVRLCLEKVSDLGNGKRASIATISRGQNVRKITEGMRRELSSATSRLPNAKKNQAIKDLLKKAADNLTLVEAGTTDHERTNYFEVFMEAVNEAITHCRAEFETVDSQES